MSLIKLRQFQTISEKAFLESYNALTVAADTNFDYLLNNVVNPLPDTTNAAVNSVLTLVSVNSNKVLAYQDPNALVNAQVIFNAFLNANSTLTANKEFELLLNSLNSSFAKFTVSARTRFGTGTIKNYVAVNQISNDGDLTETHVMNSFTLTANTVALTSTATPIQVNSLRVGDYAFPATSGSIGQVLRVAANNVLQFATVQEPILATTTQYTLAETKPLILQGNNNIPVIGFNDNNSGIFVTATTGLSDSYWTLKFNNAEIFSAITPAAVAFGAPNAPYLSVKAPLVLPSSQNIANNNSYEGSIWYDALNKAITLVTATGPLSIKGQVITAAVNTEEVKTFTLQPDAALALGGGNDTNPALKIGTTGISSASGDMHFTVGNTTAFKATPNGLESAAGATGAAKINLSSNLGINNPANPTYSFSGANKLGLYRAGTDSLGVAVKGNPVAEFKDTGLDVKNTRVTNVAPPTDNKDAVNKEYVDSIVPTGTSPGAVPTVDSTGKYVQSTLRYANNKLEIGNNNANAAISLKTAGGGSLTLKAGGSNQHIDFTLPSNTLANGLLQIDAARNTAWVDKDTLIQGLLKTDGSVTMSSGVKVNTSTSKENLLIGVGNLGFYATSGNMPKLGIAAENKNMLEIDVRNKTLTGIDSTFNAPFIRLDSSLSSYTALGENASAAPTYAFAGEPTTGIGQTTIHGVSMLVMGTAKLTANETGLLAHNNRIQNVSMPVANSDAATKEYVDKTLKLPVEISFRVTALPVGYTSTDAIILSLYDKAIIANSSAQVMPYEGSTDPASVLIPSNFSTNPKCQCYINNNRLVKMAAASGIRQVNYLTNRSLLINYSIAVGDIITVQIGE